MPSLQKFAAGVWIADGPQVRDMGVMFTTRMSIVKLSDGSLWVSSPVPATFDTLADIGELGTVGHLVAGTPRHVWRLELWHTLFPDAELWVTPQVNKRTNFFVVGSRKQPLASILRDAPPHAWAADIDQLIFKGCALIDEVIFFHKKSRTVILDDLIQRNLNVKGRPIQNALFKLDHAAYPGGVILDVRATTTNRHLARQSLEKLLSWDFDRLIIAHGVCLEHDAKPFVEEAFQWLRR